MLDRRPNLNDVDNTDISNSENEMIRIMITIVDNESGKDNTLCIALLYRYPTHTHIRTNLHDHIVDRTSLFISLVSFKIINSRSHNVLLYY